MKCVFQYDLIKKFQSEEGRRHGKMTSENVTSVGDFFKNVFQLTLDKRGSDAELYKEYFALEDVPPAPGQPHKQHNAMVKNGFVTQVQNV